MKIKTFVIFVAILLSFPTKAFASNTTHVEILTSNIISLTSANIDVRIKSQGIVNESEYEIKVQVFDTQSENRHVMKLHYKNLVLSLFIKRKKQ